MTERRAARVRQKVIHRHRTGSLAFKRVSELVVIQGQPKAILRWIDIAGVRTPICVDLDPDRLRRIQAGHRTAFHYDGITVDPAYQPAPMFDGRRRLPSQPISGGRRSTDPRP